MGDGINENKISGKAANLLFAQFLLPLFVLLDHFQSVAVVPAVTVPAFVTNFRDIIFFHSVAVAEEGTVIF